MSVDKMTVNKMSCFPYNLVYEMSAHKMTVDKMSFCPYNLVDEMSVDKMTMDENVTLSIESSRRDVC